MSVLSVSCLSAVVGVLPVGLVLGPPGVVQVLALRPLLLLLKRLPLWAAAAAAMAPRGPKVEVEP